jgi:hypothetical protein
MRVKLIKNGFHGMVMVWSWLVIVGQGFGVINDHFYYPMTSGVGRDLKKN